MVFTCRDERPNTGKFHAKLFSFSLSVLRENLRLNASLSRVNTNLLYALRGHFRLHPLFLDRIVLHRRLHITLGSNRQHFRLIKRLGSPLPLPLLRNPLLLWTTNRYVTRNLRYLRDTLMLPRLHTKGRHTIRFLPYRHLHYNNRLFNLPNRRTPNPINTPRRHPRRRRGTRGTIRNLRVQRRTPRHEINMKRDVIGLRRTGHSILRF